MGERQERDRELQTLLITSSDNADHARRNSRYEMETDECEGRCNKEAAVDRVQGQATSMSNPALQVTDTA